MLRFFKPHGPRQLQSLVLGGRRAASTASGEKYFDKILIANRGEISCRVIRTCKSLGIKTVAIYSEPDAHNLHVRMADEAICVGPAASNASYLNIPNIMEAIKKTGAQAVHPGYGFLSENVKFCQALKDEGVVFIGPDPHAIHAMGDKIESKQIAIDAGVNTIPGFQDIIKDEAHCVQIANQIGYPVMIKASAGGGGKGMRIAYNDEEAELGFRLSSEESYNSFGDDRLFVEKFIEDPRHIEIQVLADSFGNVAAFPERECSIQRRNQKVIEEAPSVLLDEETRHRMQEQAKMLAKAVQYKSAGTVEMLCDKNKNFYFLEMNTRLQVEHPITELVSGVDLVEQMIRVAAGYKLPDKLLKKIPPKGWAIEARVYAEDPTRGFLPSTGRLLKYEEPAHVEGVRVDSGIVEGSDISMFYDPMISKLVTYADDRKQAIARMERALDDYVIRGPGHNIAFLRDLMRHPRFRKGTITTKFIAEEYPEGFDGVHLTENEKHELLAISAVLHKKRSAIAATINGKLPNYTKPPAKEIVCLFGGAFGEPTEASVSEGSTDTSYIVRLKGKDGKDVTINIDDFDWPIDHYILAAKVNGRDVSAQLINHLPEGFQIQYQGAVEDVVVRTPLAQQYAKHMQKKPEVDRSRFLQCPMPGLLVSLSVAEGEEVEAGQELCVVEAMKMQNVLRSPKKAKVKSISCAEGSTLKVDQVILEFE